jgi:hypothetical protein
MPLLDSDMSVAKKLFHVNVFASAAVTHAFAPLLIMFKGTVVSIGSLAGTLPFPWQGALNVELRFSRRSTSSGLWGAQAMPALFTSTIAILHQRQSISGKRWGAMSREYRKDSELSKRSCFFL